MRWPTVGTTVAMHRTVAPADAAGFDDDPDIHPVYSTVAQVRDVEHVGRWLFRRGLQDGEEGAGASLEIRHHSPVPVGADVVIFAEVVHAQGRRLSIEAKVLHAGAEASEATFTQVIIDPERF